MALGFQRQGIFGRKPMFPQDDILSNGPYGTPGFGDGFNQRMFGGEDMEAVNSNPNAMPIGVKEITKKPGFFGQGGVGRAIAGTIGDFLLQQSGMDPIYLPNVLQQRDAEERARMAQQQRMQEREDYAWKAQYDRANPKPVNNDTVNDLNWYKSLSEEDRRLYHQMKPVVGYMADGTPRVINPYEVQQPNLDSQPASEDGYDYTPGPGGRANPSNWKKSGGQAANPPATFR